MTEPDVVLTDYALALACFVFAGLLWRSRRSEPVAFWFALGFAATAVAALAGGTVHGYGLFDRALFRRDQLHPGHFNL